MTFTRAALRRSYQRICYLGRASVHICHRVDRNRAPLGCVEPAMTQKPNTPRLRPATKCEPDLEPAPVRRDADSARRVWDYIAARKHTCEKGT